MPISQADAHTLIEAAQAHAQTLGITVTVAVVDAGGLVKAMDRMDGAPPLSAQIAEAKAQGAAVWHRDGHVLGEVAQERPAFVSAVSQMTRLPLIAGAGSLVIRDGDGTCSARSGSAGESPTRIAPAARLEPPRWATERAASPRGGPRRPITAQPAVSQASSSDSRS